MITPKICLFENSNSKLFVDNSVRVCTFLLTSSQVGLKKYLTKTYIINNLHYSSSNSTRYQIHASNPIYHNQNPMYIFFYFIHKRQVSQYIYIYMPHIILNIN